MNVDKLVDAIGLIDEEKIQKAKEAGRSGFLFRKTAALIAAIVVCLGVLLPVIAVAADIEPAYQMLYHISPAIAQKLKPVRLSCEDQGIRMEVESAYVDENEVNIVVSMKDLVGTRVDETMDLYDSYHINRPFDSTGTCSRLGYDEETGKAAFLITISQWGERDIGGEKITFSVGEFLSNKQEFSGEIFINLSEVSETPDVEHYPMSGAGGREVDFDEIGKEPFLTPNHSFGEFVVDGIEFTGCGYYNGKLHLQIAVVNRLENDNHGRFYFVGESGEEIYCEYSRSFRQEEGGAQIDYTQYTFDIPREELDQYRLFGYFVTSEGTTKGSWQVTFPLERQQ